MNDQTNPATACLAAIRDASRATKLMALSDLASMEQEPTGTVVLEKGTAVSIAQAEKMAASPDKPSLQPEEIESLLSAQAEEDIKLMRGSLDVYYFSDKYMTSAYALHLFRVAEKDPAKMIADTVRDESRIYPRPTPVASFLEAPFRMSKAALEGVLWQITQRNDMDDIKTTTASDGSIYLYSTKHLSVVHADSLAEWDAVGQVENP